MRISSWVAMTGVIVGGNGVAQWVEAEPPGRISSLLRLTKIRLITRRAQRLLR